MWACIFLSSHQDQESFLKAAEEAKVLKQKPDNGEMSDLYGLFKQAIVGDVNIGESVQWGLCVKVFKHCTVHMETLEKDCCAVFWVILHLSKERLIVGRGSEAMRFDRFCRYANDASADKLYNTYMNIQNTKDDIFWLNK